MAKRRIFETKAKSKLRERLKKYRLSEDDLKWFMFEQKGRCAICDQPGLTLCIDHIEKNGYFLVRGLLCRSCNAGLGLFKDSDWRLKRAINYLAAQERIDWDYYAQAALYQTNCA